MNPMDNAQITSQMAALSTVSGIGQLNTTLSALSNTMSLGSCHQHDRDPAFWFPVLPLSLASGQATGGVTLTGPADSLSVTIKDASGNTVQTLNLGAQKAGGVVPFAWNGSTTAGATAPDGSYTFTAQAVHPVLLHLPPL